MYEKKFMNVLYLLALLVLRRLRYDFKREYYAFDATMTTTTSNTTSSQKKNYPSVKKCLVVWFGYPRLVAVLCTYHNIMFVSIHSISLFSLSVYRYFGIQ